jgi:hypothetical protein
MVDRIGVAATVPAAAPALEHRAHPLNLRYSAHISLFYCGSLDGAVLFLMRAITEQSLGDVAIKT